MLRGRRTDILLLSEYFLERFARRTRTAIPALRLTTLITEIDADRQQAEPYFRMRDVFSMLAESKVIWDTLDRRRVDRFVERSAASEAITREPVGFQLNTCHILNWEQKVPHLANKNGGDLYLYPGFVLCRASREAFALIDFREVTLTYKPQRFIEDQLVPSDAQVVDKAWAKVTRTAARTGGSERIIRSLLQFTAN